MATAETDFYELLEVQRTADDKTIKSSYRRIAMLCHPDKNPGCKESEAKFKAVSTAYSCLSDPQKRAAYDRFGHAAFENGGAGGFGGGAGGEGFSDLGDIFETIFGGAVGGGRQQGARRGENEVAALGLAAPFGFGATAGFAAAFGLTATFGFAAAFFGAAFLPLPAFSATSASASSSVTSSGVNSLGSVALTLPHLMYGP